MTFRPASLRWTPQTVTVAACAAAGCLGVLIYTAATLMADTPDVSVLSEMPPTDQPAGDSHTEPERGRGRLYAATRTPDPIQPQVIEDAADKLASTQQPLELIPDPQDPELMLVLAHRIGEQATTEEELTRIIRLCENAVEDEISDDNLKYARSLAAWTYNRRGEVRDEDGEYDDALADFELAIELEGDRWRAIHNRGVSFARAGMFREAFDDFSRTVQLNPAYAKAYSNRAALYEEIGNPMAALVDYRQAIKLEVTLAAAHAGRGRVCHRLNKIKIAVVELNEAVRLEPDNPMYHAMRADVFADVGKYEEALDDYGRSIQLNPQFGIAYRNGSWLLATCPDDEFRDEENAITGAEKALELCREERHLCLDALAAALASAGSYDEAVVTIRRAIAEAPEQFRPYYQQRLELYEAGMPYRSQPVRQAGFNEPSSPMRGNTTK